MVDAYLDVALFAVVALLVPAILLIFSRAFGLQSRHGKMAVSESDESERSAQGPGIAVEYSHYLSLFLMFCVLAAITVIWSLFVRNLDFAANMKIEFLLVFGFVLSVFVLVLNRGGR